MPNINHWRVWCENESSWKDWYLPEDDSQPTLCPTNSAHTITGDKTYVQGVSQGVVNVDSEGNLATIQEPRPGTEKNFYAPNMCDPCAWYAGSVSVIEQAMTDSGDQKTYTSGVPWWIDMTHGRVFKEDAVLAENAGKYLVKVEVQEGGSGPWVEKTQNSWGQTDEDYDVDYEDGKVVFNDALDASDLVRASFYKKDVYEFYIEPAAGKKLKIVKAEVQYTIDIEFNRGVWFILEAYYPDPPPERIPVAQYTFKTLRNFYEESTGPYPVIPPHGAEWETVEVTGISNIEAKQDLGYTIIGTRFDDPDWVALMRGMKDGGGREVRHALVTIPFDYNAFLPLQSSIGTRIRIAMDNDEPFGGTFGNITFYCLTEDE